MKDLYFTTCPNCGSPEYVDSWDYYKCLECLEIFEYPLEVPIEPVCPRCNEHVHIDVLKVEDDGSVHFACGECGQLWTDC